MKSPLAALTVATLATLAPAILHAQTESVVYGRATITLTPAVVQQLASLGLTVTNLSQSPLANGVNTLTALEGAIDLKTSFNEVVYSGGYRFTVGTTTMTIQNMTLDLTSSAAVFSAVLIENGAFIGREDMFSISLQGPPPSLPIIPVNGTISHDGLLLTPAPNFVSLINGALGRSVLNTTEQIGTLDLYSVLVPPATN